MPNDLAKNLLGELPEVPFSVEVEDQTIIRLAIAAIVVFVVCALVQKLLK